MTGESLCEIFGAEGITLRLLIDQIRLQFNAPQPVPARRVHTVIRKMLGERSVYGYTCHPQTAEERQKAAYCTFAVAIHELIPDRKRRAPGISMAQLKTLCATLVPGTDPTIDYSEITMDCYERTPLSLRTRAELALAFVLRCAAAVGMSKIKGANKKGEAPSTFKTGDTEAMIQHLMTGFSLFTKDSTGRELKVYIKTHDTQHVHDKDAGKSETHFRPLPPHEHRLRIEWTFKGDASPLKTLDDLLNLKPLANLFYANLLGARSTKQTCTALRPARPGYRRKKPQDARADTRFNRWVKDTARSFKMAETHAEKGAVKTVLKTLPTEGKVEFLRTQTLRTCEAPSGPVFQPVGHAEGISFSSASLSMPGTVPTHLGHQSSLQQLGQASPLTFDKRPTGATHQALN